MPPNLMEENGRAREKESEEEEGFQAAGLAHAKP